MADTRYRWFVLALAALTHTLVMGMPSMALSVLFPEITRDLSLTLVQQGWIWGIGSLTGVVMALLGGVVGDRIGAKRALMSFCVLAGGLGALRGLAAGFATLMLATMLYGLFTAAIPTNVHKSCGIWFGGRQLGMANGVASTGMALGFMLGAGLSATVLSPWLGGWRAVLVFYGAVALAVGLVWSTTRPGPAAGTTPRPAPVSIRQGFAYVARIRTLWLLAFALFGISGGINGGLGYLPTYLERAGWSTPMASSALSAFHAISMVCAIPIAILSDRLGSRRGVLLVAAGMTAAGFMLLGFASGVAVWAAVLLAGCVRDGFMAVMMTSIIETPGVGARWAGTAMGLVSAISAIGIVISPPLGNSLARLAPGLPFLFWAALVLMGMAGLHLAFVHKPVPVREAA
jgi:MFS family permease